MILYDQNFKFIGMSAETLTFLGYENIDEFCSMHGDFADLFIKREGYIHKFENFSWIHYILYSGAANKKALIAKKNGGELSVEITIKEVFLNGSYDGLEKIYSVKLINENFTTISKSDVQDQRSHNSTHFSLQNLTKDLDAPKEVSQNLMQEKDKSDTVLPEPLLNIEKEFAQKAEEEEPAMNLPEHSGFILGSFEDTLEKESEDEMNEPTHEKSAFASELFSKSDSSVSIPDIAAEAEEDSALAVKSTRPAESENEDNRKTPAKEFELNFEIFAQNDKDEKNESGQSRTEDESQRDSKKPFEIEEGFSAEQKNEDGSDDIKTDDGKEDGLQDGAFSLDLFKPASSEASQEIAKESLISQIKSDIKEIDEEVNNKPDAEEMEVATAELKKLLKIDSDALQSSREEPKESETKLADEKKSCENEANENNEESKRDTGEQIVSDFIKTDEKKEKKSQNDSYDAKSYDIGETVCENSQKESSFEETLKDIFTQPLKNKDTENTRSPKDNNDSELTFTLVSESEDNDEKTEENQQSITKELIKSDDDIRLQQENKGQLALPPLGALGLSREEELDFIDEFLKDTVSTVSLIEEYIKIDDFDNIKYSLIKIKSSAEILGFDAINDIVKSLTESCDEKDKPAIVQKLQRLKKDTTAYREHFAAIAV